MKSSTPIQTKPIPTNPRFKDISKQVFNHLTVIGFYDQLNGVSRWVCLCVCGNYTITTKGNLEHNHTTSCGCVRIASIVKIRVTHGHSRNRKKSSEYNSYSSAKNRCQNTQYAEYEYYGGRGIEFRFNSFEEFLDELGKKPSVKHSIERIDNNGHYEKGNVKWSTATKQGRNKRNNIFLTVKGETKLLQEWSEISSIKPATISKRFYEYNWCADCAVSLLPNANRQKCKHLKT